MQHPSVGSVVLSETDEELIKVLKQILLFPAKEFGNPVIKYVFWLTIWRKQCRELVTDQFQIHSEKINARSHLTAGRRKIKRDVI